MRKFAVAKGFEDKEVNLPVRATKHAAGYDFEAVEDIVIPSIWKQILSGKVLQGIKPELVHTGIKAQMESDESLKLFNRSGNPKLGLILANGVGVVDSDYFENPGNDGEIMFAFFNFWPKDVLIKKCQRIDQGVYEKFMLTKDEPSEAERVGGFVSKNKK
mgnify:CR=1 FL=1